MDSSERKKLEMRAGLSGRYRDVLGAGARSALEALEAFEDQRRALMGARYEGRAQRFREGRPLDFLPANEGIEGTDLGVADAL